MTLLTRAIAYVSPRWAARRRVAELAYRQLGLISTRRYDGARIKATDKYWLPSNSDVDSSLLPDLVRLRARSRNLLENNPWAGSIMCALLSHVIGKRGIAIQVSGRDKERAKKAEKWLKAQLDNIDITGRKSWKAMQEMAFRQVLEAGECFARFAMPKRALKVQFIEPDQIWTTQISVNRNEIRAGIEIEHGTERHVSYYVNYHPGAYRSTIRKAEEKRILAKDMIHPYVEIRPGQTRGVPILAPVISHLHDLGEYLEAELVSARVASCFSVMIKRDYDPDSTSDSEGNNIQNLHPGMVARLQPGESVEVINAKRSTEPFGSFTMLMLRAIGASVGLTYETVAKDYKNTSFSAGRMGLLVERAIYRGWQQFMIDTFCKPIVSEIVKIAELTGVQRFTGLEISYLPGGFEWVDPEKEVKAKILEIENNLATKKGVVAERGKDLEEVLEQREKEVKEEKKRGIQTITAPKFAAAISAV